MSSTSSIEWTDATWNPTRGCTRVSEGCRNCYAEVMAARFSAKGQWGHGFAEIGHAYFNDSAGGPETLHIGPVETRSILADDQLGNTQAVRVGKKAAGRRLEGVEHNGFPAPPTARAAPAPVRHSPEGAGGCHSPEGVGG